MATIFCSSCGSKSEYKFSPPKFCSSCGSPMASINNNAPAPVAPVKPVAIGIEATTEDSEGYTNASQIPRISNLVYEIDDFGAGVQHTLGSLAGKEAPKRRKRNVKQLGE